MIVSFPSPLQEFEATRSVPKNEPTQYAHLAGHPWGLVFSSPINLQPGDHVWIDMRSGDVQIVERGGIAIWRTGWLN